MKKIIFSLFCVITAVSVAAAYQVQKGDTLSQIAVDNKTTVKELVRLNPYIKNPNLIYPGNEICLPSDSGCAKHLNNKKEESKKATEDSANKKDSTAKEESKQAADKSSSKKSDESSNSSLRVGGYAALRATLGSLKNKHMSDIAVAGDVNGIDDTFRRMNLGGRFALGLSFNDTIRTELEYGINTRTRATDDTVWSMGTLVATDYAVKTSVQSLFANFYWDINNKSSWTPYVGFGLGAAKAKTRVSAQNSVIDFEQKLSDTSFAWNAGAGVSFEMSPHTALEIGYRYANYGKASDAVANGGVAIVGESKLSAHEALLGLRYKF